MPELLGAQGGVCRNFWGLRGGYARTFGGLGGGMPELLGAQGGLGWVGLDSPDLKNATDPSIEKFGSPGSGAIIGVV